MAKKRTFSCRTNAGNDHSRQDGPIFLAWVANQNAVFVSPCLPVTQLYINNHIYYELSSRGKVCYFSIYVF